MRKRYLLLLFLSIILTLAVPALFSGPKVFKDVLRLPPSVALGLLGIILASWVFNTARVRYLLSAMDRPVSFFEGAIITIATEFAGTATPASSGMPVTYVFLLSRKGFRLGKATGLVAIIMLLDILFFGVTMLLAALAMLVLHATFFQTSYMIGVAFGIVVVGGLGLWTLVRHFRPVYHRVSHFMARFEWLSKRRYKMARGTVEFLRAMRVLGSMSWKRRILLFLLSTGYWLPRYLVLIVAVSLVTNDIPVAYLFLLQGLLNLGGQAFILPSGGGGVDAAYMALMGPYLDHANLAFTLIIWRAYTFYWYLVVGGPIFLLKTGRAAKDLLSRSRPQPQKG